MGRILLCDGGTQIAGESFMAPVSGLQIHYTAPWELLGAPNQQEQSATRSYRRIWKSIQIFGGPDANHTAALNETSEIHEYIYLLIDADTAIKAEQVANILKTHIDENIQKGFPPDNVDFKCPNETCSYVIRMQGHPDL